MQTSPTHDGKTANEDLVYLDEDTRKAFLEPMDRNPLPCVLILHEVADYPAWKKIFDGAAAIRREAGERSYQVLRYENDPNRIVHFSGWTSLADVRRFFESPRLVKIRAEAGVKSPEFIYLEELAAGTL